MEDKDRANSDVTASTLKNGSEANETDINYTNVKDGDICTDVYGGSSWLCPILLCMLLSQIQRNSLILVHHNYTRSHSSVSVGTGTMRYDITRFSQMLSF